MIKSHCDSQKWRFLLFLCRISCKNTRFTLQLFCNKRQNVFFSNWEIEPQFFSQILLIKQHVRLCSAVAIYRINITSLWQTRWQRTSLIAHSIDLYIISPIYTCIYREAVTHLQYMHISFESWYVIQIIPSCKHHNQYMRRSMPT